VDPVEDDGVPLVAGTVDVVDVRDAVGFQPERAFGEPAVAPGPHQAAVLCPRATAEDCGRDEAVHITQAGERAVVGRLRPLDLQRPLLPVGVEELCRLHRMHQPGESTSGEGVRAHHHYSMSPRELCELSAGRVPRRPGSVGVPLEKLERES